MVAKYYRHVAVADVSWAWVGSDNFCFTIEGDARYLCVVSIREGDLNDPSPTFTVGGAFWKGRYHSSSPWMRAWMRPLVSCARTVSIRRIEVTHLCIPGRCSETRTERKRIRHNATG